MILEIIDGKKKEKPTVDKVDSGATSAEPVGTSDAKKEKIKAKVDNIKMICHEKTWY